VPQIAKSQPTTHSDADAEMNRILETHLNHKLLQYLQISHNHSRKDNFALYTLKY